MNPHTYLANFSRFGTKGGFKPGLDRINQMLDYFSHPEKNLQVIHVAGSNGKGSTIAFLKTIYQQAGYQAGVFTSPSLLRLNERIMINDYMISDRELSDLIIRIKPVIEKISADKNIGKPSFFEVLTLLAFLYFDEKKVDIVLLEVGLGGRLDATNVIKNPLVSVIVNISLEHTAILGNTLAEIAREKAGIIKEKKPVVTAVTEKEALAEIRKKSSEKNCELIEVDKEYNYSIDDLSWSKQKFTVSEKKSDKEIQLEITMPGEHQIKNALLAYAVVKEIDYLYPVQEKALLAGLKKTNWPGRMEVVRKKPLIILDGAHNPAGMKTLVAFLEKMISPVNKLWFVLSFSGDKDIETIFKILNFQHSKMEFILTKINSNRAMDVGKLIKEAEKNNLEYIVEKNFRKAVLSTINNASDHDIICITGSLFTVAKAKEFF